MRARERGIKEYRNGAEVYLELAMIELARRQYWRFSDDRFRRPGGVLSHGRRGEKQRGSRRSYRRGQESIWAGI
jgi:hypothetical protein